MITELKSCFDDLKARLSDLTGHLNTERPHHFYPLSDTEQAINPDPIHWANDHLADLWYMSHEQDGRTTRSRHGLILASPETQLLIKEVNDCKEAFARVSRTLRGTSEANLKSALSALDARGSSFRNLIGNASGLRRIHLKQCTRTLPLLDEYPVSCRFTWYAHGRSIKRISVKEAEQALLDIGEEKAHVQAQLKILGNLPPSSKLAQVQTLAPTVRANVVFQSGRKSLNCPLPIFVATDNPHGELPNIKDVPLTPPEGRSRKSREDNLISEAPILPSLRVHTYE
ncbi:DNA replication terminus site-binding protein [Thalassolituus sp.]|uniref:DNA replication terminus site-binding protein n=1 Tax=Thalassolituus sp. TaxID=2030822 RepID=UPI00243A6529|nr:DNA replication terminus site-binding protein [Thalassolituus sp.]